MFLNTHPVYILQDSTEEGDESEAEEAENVASDATSDTSLEESDLEVDF